MLFIEKKCINWAERHWCMFAFAASFSLAAFDELRLKMPLTTFPNVALAYCSRVLRWKQRLVEAYVVLDSLIASDGKRGVDIISISSRSDHFFLRLSTFFFQIFSSLFMPSLSPSLSLVAAAICELNKTWQNRVKPTENQLTGNFTSGCNWILVFMTAEMPRPFSRLTAIRDKEAFCRMRMFCRLGSGKGLLKSCQWSNFHFWAPQRNLSRALSSPIHT